jgi:hypothetical protein
MNDLGYIMPDNLESRMSDPLRDVRLLAREKRVDADHLVSTLHQIVAEMGTCGG